MANYGKAGRTGVFAARMILLLSVAAMIMFSGCSSSYKHSVSGRITSGGAGLANVTVTLSGPFLATTTTDINGDYIFDGLSNGTFTVTPSLAGYTFVLPSRPVYLYGISAPGFDFSGIPEGRLSAAAAHTVYMKADGTVWVWGSSSNG
jgi:hypothetical protein